MFRYFTLIQDFNQPPEMHIDQIELSLSNASYGYSTPSISFRIKNVNKKLIKNVSGWADEPEISIGQNFTLITFLCEENIGDVIGKTFHFMNRSHTLQVLNADFCHYILQFQSLIQEKPKMIDLDIIRKKLQIHIDPTNTADITNNDLPYQQLFNYISAKTKFDVFHSSRQYEFSSFTVTFSHTLIKKISFDKKEKKFKYHHYTNEKKFSYFVLNINEKNCKAQGAYGYIYQINGVLKQPDNGLPRTYLSYPSIFSEKKRPKLVKVVEFQSPSEINLLKKEYEMTLFAGNNPSPLILEKFLGKIRYAYLALEQFEGINLLDFIKKNIALPIETFVKIAINILSELKILHEKDIIHRDFNPKNIIINENTYKIKIIDFGASIWKNELPHLMDVRCTLPYLAPEISIQQPNMQTEKIDNYSAALTILHLLQDNEFLTSDYKNQSDEETFKDKQNAYYANKIRIIKLPQNIVDELGDEHERFCEILIYLAANRSDARLSLEEALTELQSILMNLQMRNQTSSTAQMMKSLGVSKTQQDILTLSESNLDQNNIPLPVTSNASVLDSVSTQNDEIFTSETVRKLKFG